MTLIGIFALYAVLWWIVFLALLPLWAQAPSSQSIAQRGAKKRWGCWIGVTSCVTLLIVIVVAGIWPFLHAFLLR